MPGQFLSQDERDRLSYFPPGISDDELIAYFTLTPEDNAVIGKQRRPHNRLGFAILLCALRYLGFFPLDLARVPAKVIAFVAGQLELDPCPSPIFCTSFYVRINSLSVCCNCC